jgi:hypothetical protein
LFIKTLDPDWIRIRVGIQPKMLDPYLYQMNTDPKHYRQTLNDLSIKNYFYAALFRTVKQGFTLIWTQTLHLKIGRLKLL